MKKAFSILLFLLLIAFSLCAQTKHALVIGLGEQEDKHWAKINGDKDVPYVLDMLSVVGYDDIKTLINKEAIKDSIIASFEALRTKCNEGDIVYIHFSGHGQLVTDVNGDEDDGWDESWIPYDAYLRYCDNDKGEKHLIDDEINEYLVGIKAQIGDIGAMLVVVDACHSGDSTRDYVISETVRGVYEEFVIPGNYVTKIGKSKEQWLVLSACKDYQLNQELKDPEVGKLTYVLYQLVNEGGVTMKSVERRMAKYRNELPQTPVLTGALDKYQLNTVLR